MSGFNHRGPEGQGPMTGRKMGRCTNFGATLKNKNETKGEDQTGNKSEIVRNRGFGFGQEEGGYCRGMGLQNRYRRRL
ncbi:MAG: DUF5320 domain-containing protein [Bacteroidales bacterium]|nr:DUF5320 domain-containing protein [Bacteroidales bacterium]